MTGRWSLAFNFSPPTATATLPELATTSELPYSPDPPSSSPIARRFPPPPTLSAAPLERPTTSGHKRGRGWFASVSGVILDRPQEEVSLDGEGGGAGGGLFAKSWETVSNYGELHKYDEGAEEEDEDERPAKRGFVGTAGSLLSHTADILIVGGALAYSGYQLWRKPIPPNQDVDNLLTARLHPSPRTEAPPPYVPNTLTPSPSQIPRRIRHAHTPRPRASIRRTSLPTPPADPTPSSTFDSFFAPLSSPLPRFEPLEPLEDGSEEDEEDDEMKAMALRMQAMIDEGRAALLTSPTFERPRPIVAPRSAPMPSTKRFEDPSSSSSTGTRPAWGAGGRINSPGHQRRQTLGALPGLEGSSVVIPFGGNRERRHPSRQSMDSTPRKHIPE